MHLQMSRGRGKCWVANLGWTQPGVALQYDSVMLFLGAVDPLGHVFMTVTETQEHKPSCMRAFQESLCHIMSADILLVKANHITEPNTKSWWRLYSSTNQAI